jgi:LPXTG-site transpeptidase (sortase) family protein
MPREIYLKLSLPPAPPLTKFQKVVRIFGFVLVLFALTLLMPKETNLSFAKEDHLIKEVQTYNPTRIDIEKIGVSLPIGETSIKDGKWSINPDGASHLDISADPGVEGNIIIYDHNLIHRFGKISELKPGDIIVVTSEDKKEYRYKVYETIIVDPTQVDVLHNYDTQTLTLYTCYGFLDSKRFVVKAERV